MALSGERLLQPDALLGLAMQLSKEQPDPVPAPKCFAVVQHANEVSAACLFLLVGSVPRTMIMCRTSRFDFPH